MLAFARRYELERHRKSRHGLTPAVGDKRFYSCIYCRDQKIWTRVDHLRQHAQRLHPSANAESLVRVSVINTNRNLNNLPVVAGTDALTLDNSCSLEAPPHVQDTTPPSAPVAAEKDSLSDLDKVLRGTAVDVFTTPSLPALLRQRGRLQCKDSAVDLRSLQADAACEPLRGPTPAIDMSTGTAGLAQRRKSRPEGEHTNSGSVATLAHPHPVRPTRKAVAALHEHAHKSSEEAVTNHSDSTLASKSVDKAPAPGRPTKDDDSKLVSGVGNEVPVITCTGRLHAGRNTHRHTQSNRSNGRQPSANADTGYNDGVPFGQTAPNPGLRSGNDHLYNGEESSEEVNGFPCVFHRFQDPATDPTPHCRRLQKFVSKLAKHHQARLHPDGSFIYCTQCFSRDFDSERTLSQHKQQGCRFLCVTENCDNYNQVPTNASPCSSHQAGHNSQVSIWRKLYRIAHNKGPHDVVPDPGSFSVTSSSPRPPSGQYLTVPNTPIDGRLSPTETPTQAPNYMPFAIGSLPGPATSPAHSSLSRSDSQSTAEQLEQSLGRLARIMWTQVNRPYPEWTLVTFGWYRSVMQLSEPVSESSHDVDRRLTGQLTLLRTLVEEYQQLIDDSSRRTLNAWLQVRELTQFALQLGVDALPPWSQDQAPSPSISLNSVQPGSSLPQNQQLLGPTIDSALPVPQPNAGPANTGNTVNTVAVFPAVTLSHQTHDFETDVQSAISQSDQTSSTFYDRLRRSAHQDTTTDVPILRTEPSDPTYASGSASGPPSSYNGSERRYYQLPLNIRSDSSWIHQPHNHQDC